MTEPTAPYQILDLGPLQSWEGKSFGRDLLGLSASQVSIIRVNPGVQRSWLAGAEGITFICTQTKSGSMPEPKGDGIRLPEVLPSWAKA
jgi:hypothetical protein